MTDPACPRKTPCASCPYRRNAPSGVWAPEEYAKLPEYDKPTAEQPTAVFMCHQGVKGDVCSGWLGHSDPTELLALRLAILRDEIDLSCFDYETTVPLFASGREAADHGMRDLYTPGKRAQDTMRKIVKVRDLDVDDAGQR